MMKRWMTGALFALAAAAAQAQAPAAPAPAAPAGGSMDHGSMAGMDHAAMGHGMDAASMVTATSPKQGESVSSPAAFTITFMHPMKLSQVRLADDLGQTIPVAFTPPAAEAPVNSVALPKLSAGQYELHWTAAMKPRDISGVVAFSVR